MWPMNCMRITGGNNPRIQGRDQYLMSEKKAYLPITKEQIDQLAAEMETARNELNQMAGDLRTVSDDVLELSNKLDMLVNKFMKLSTLYKTQNRTK